jgi:hypothetical protein
MLKNLYKLSRGRVAALTGADGWTAGHSNKAVQIAACAVFQAGFRNTVRDANQL